MFSRDYFHYRNLNRNNKKFRTRTCSTISLIHHEIKTIYLLRKDSEINFEKLANVVSERQDPHREYREAYQREFYLTKFYLDFKIACCVGNSRHINT